MKQEPSHSLIGTHKGCRYANAAISCSGSPCGCHFQRFERRCGSDGVNSRSDHIIQATLAARVADFTIAAENTGSQSRI